MNASLRSPGQLAERLFHQSAVHLAVLINGAGAHVPAPARTHHRHAGAADPTDSMGWDPPDQRAVGDVSGNDRAGGHQEQA